MFGVAAAEILWCAYVLWRVEFGQEIIVLWTIKWSFSIDRRFTDYARLVDVVILESVIEDAIGKNIAVMMAIRATSATGRNFVCEELLTARDLIGLGLRRDLRERVRKEARFILRPKNL